MTWLADREHRKYLYGISLALLPILVAIGWVTESMAPLIVVALGSVLTPALALNNLTPKDPDAQ
jgi:hypothetical protein